MCGQSRLQNAQQRNQAKNSGRGHIHRHDAELAHTAELEMMMDRRHLEDALAARFLEIGHLNHDRQAAHEHPECDQHQNQRLTQQHGRSNHRTADEHGARIRRDLEGEGIYTGAMQIRKDCSSSIAYCWIEKATGKRSIAWARGNFAELSGDEVNLELIRKAKIVHFDGHNPQGAIAAAKEARQHGVIVSLDAGTLRPEIKDLLPYVTILIASEDFARCYTGEEDLEKALLKLGENGSEVTGITMGCKGSMVLENGKAVYCPAFKIQAVDTTGAGDVYHGAFAVRYCETRDLRESMLFASAVSALKCLKPGGRTGIPTRAEVEKFLAENA